MAERELAEHERIVEQLTDSISRYRESRRKLEEVANVLSDVEKSLRSSVGALTEIADTSQITKGLIQQQSANITHLQTSLVDTDRSIASLKSDTEGQLNGLKLVADDHQVRLLRIEHTAEALMKGIWILGALIVIASLLILFFN